jgi:hypothetical protein
MTAQIVIVKHAYAGGRRYGYFVGRVTDLAGRSYFVPERDPERPWAREFSSQVEARRFARGLGDVIPGFFEQDHMVPIAYAVITEAAANARRAPFVALGYN